MDIIIIGAGDIGFNLAKRLTLDKHNITVIEKDEQKVKNISEQLDVFVVEGSGTSYKTLKKANVGSADVLAALTNIDEANILACQIAKKAGVSVTIARVRNPEFEEEDFILKPKDIGVDFIIHPEREAAKAIVRLINQSSATDVIEFEDGLIQLIGIRLESHSAMLNIPLKDLGLKYGNLPFRILAVKRGAFTIIPRGDDRLLNGDQLFMICSPTEMEEALSLLGKKDIKINAIMIIGGGQVGNYIARELENDIDIKIIEIDENKSLNLAETLRHSLVIKGDGSDLDLLAFEGLKDMDEFIAVTGDDETNIIMSLVAKHLKVPRTISLIRKSEYLPLTPTIGMDAVVSKQQISVNAIQKFIRSKQVALYAELPGVDAEIVEFITSEDSKIIKKPLKDIQFPKNAIVGAVLKKDRSLEIPKGDTHIEAGDKVVVFSLPSAIKNVEKLF